MFERFTDRARSVLVLAQEEARHLGHSHIGTEHILLGLIRQGDGVGAEVLASFGLSADAVRHKAVEMLGPADERGQQIPSGSPPFTPRAKKVLELALREAIQLGHGYIGTEHILLGIIREGEGAGTKVLVSLGVDLTSARQRVMQFMSEHGVHEHQEGEQRPGAVHRTGAAGTSATPRCPQCRAELAAGARFRSIEVPPDAHEDNKEPLLTYVVYCTQCGASLHMFTPQP